MLRVRAGCCLALGFGPEAADLGAFQGSLPLIPFVFAGRLLAETVTRLAGAAICVCRLGPATEPG